MYGQINHITGGDPSIVYLDGVAPPIRNMNRPSEVEDNKRMSGCAENSNQYTGAPRPATKMQNLHHQQLLQTIREDDSESRTCALKCDLALVVA
eukprot:TCALIF_10338-PA protein Name:"Protein of unknown function" AED:0.55 eAED:0.55 QI:0/0/0/0.25/1/1/4/0/93